MIENIFHSEQLATALIILISSHLTIAVLWMNRNEGQSESMNATADPLQFKITC